MSQGKKRGNEWLKQQPSLTPCIPFDVKVLKHRNSFLGKESFPAFESLLGEVNLIAAGTAALEEMGSVT